MRRSLLVPWLLLALTACGPKSTGAPDDRRCSRGEYFVPGCAEDPGIVAGCYERCAHGAACSPGTTCGTVTVMPSCALADGVACDACGEEVELCLPSAGDWASPVTPCRARRRRP